MYHFTNVDIYSVSVEGLLEQLHDIISHSSGTAEALGPAQQDTGINCCLGDGEREGEAQLQCFRVGGMFYDLGADVLAGDEVLNRGGDKVHEL